MPRIPEETIEQVRQSADIVEVVSDHVALTKRGKNHIGLCPFHDDRRPSFNVSQDKQIYKCFACGAGGNVFTFLMEMERISFTEAVRKLASQAGIPLPEARQEGQQQQEAFDALYGANDLARKYYNHLLMVDKAGSEARAYLLSRGLSEKTMDTFSLGYAPNAWDGLLEVAGRRGIPPKTLEQAGLALPHRDGTGHYDRFRNRIMFPIRAHTGRTVAFGARALDPREQAKYLNSPETPVYRKSATLYGLWKARDAIRTRGAAIVVEGYTDLLALAQRGIENTVASAGTALTSDQARLLRRYAQRAVLVFDGDAAGTAAAVRGIGALFEAGLDTRVVTLPEGHDPDSYIREHGPDGLHNLLEGAAPVLDFMVAWLATQEDLSTSDGKSRATESLAEFISRAGDSARRRFLTQEAAQKLGIDEATLIQVVQRFSRPARQRQEEASTAQRAPAFDPRPRLERELLIRIMADDDTADAVLKQIRVEDFSNGVYRRIAALIAQRRQKKQGAAVALLINQCEDPDLAQVLSALSLETGIADPDRPQPPLQDYINAFALKNLDARINALEAQLRSAGDGPDLKALMEKHRELTEGRKALIEKASSPPAGEGAPVA